MARTACRSSLAARRRSSPCSSSAAARRRNRTSAAATSRARRQRPVVAVRDRPRRRSAATAADATVLDGEAPAGRRPEPVGRPAGPAARRGWRARSRPSGIGLLALLVPRHARRRDLGRGRGDAAHPPTSGVAPDAPSSSTGCGPACGSRASSDPARGRARCCARSCSPSSTPTLDRTLHTWTAPTAAGRRPRRRRQRHRQDHHDAASSRGCWSPTAARCCSARPTRSAPRPPTSSQTWGERVGAPVVRGPEGGDPASVAFDAVQAGRRARTSTSCSSTPPAGCTPRRA